MCCYCRKQFVANRKDKKTCSDACRVGLHYALTYNPEGTEKPGNVYWFVLDEGVNISMVLEDESLTYQDMIDYLCKRFPDCAKNIRKNNPVKRL